MEIKPFNILITTANKIAKRHLKKSINLLFLPIDYIRTKEIPEILDMSGIIERKNEKLKILDIGSPQILSLSLSLYSDLWEITYLNSFQEELDDINGKSALLGLNRLRVIKADITKPESFSNLGTFDYIFSCSVFEHIYPENGGDIMASQNVAQLLKPAGYFVFSVPYYKIKFNEYREGDAYAIRGDSSGQTFFQRFYDEESLQNQIILQTGLTTTKKKYIGERFYSTNNINKRMALLIGFGKRALLLGRFFNAISNIFTVTACDYNKLKKPYIAIYSMIKEK